MTSFDPNNPSFSHERYAALLEETFQQVIRLGQLKGGEYAGDEDRLLNFRRNAKTAETTMEFIWRIYASKHWDALMQYEKDVRFGTTRQRLEGLDGRCDDLITYLILFKAMIEERRILGGASGIKSSPEKAFAGKTMPHHTEE